ncbi:MAG: type II toxin-antitoxin system YafQ family toxin [Campylobacterales bacterium]|nr:type II toxin-antitoxin system YafQ family toxin [Campylobacterales bacterium]
MKYRLFKTNSFKRSYKKLRLTDEEDLAYIEVVYNLLCNIKLVEKYKDHQLLGSMKEFRECHVKPDLLLIYMIENDVLKLVDIGSHSELFD